LAKTESDRKVLEAKKADELAVKAKQESDKIMADAAAL